MPSTARAPDAPRSGDVLVLGDGVRLWARSRLATGGSPWRMLRLSPGAAGFLRRVRDAGERGVVPVAEDRAAGALLIERGFVHPRPRPRAGAHDVQVVVPVYGRPASLERCLRALHGLDVVVVDDGSPDPDAIRAVAARNGARCVRLAVNSGPGAARNAGLAVSGAGLVAFVDSDCEPTAGWLDALVPFFDDPRVGAVAPRIAPFHGAAGVLARYEELESSLDMGEHPALVLPGSPVGYVPSATLVVRRDAMSAVWFDEELRLGEDVDLVWRLSDAGWQVRYEPSVVVGHETRDTWRAWAQRRFEYGTSAVGLEVRHGRRLAPVRQTAWNALACALLAAGRPAPAIVASVTGAGLQARRLRQASGDVSVTASLVARGIVANGAAVGHVLRREYWPIGAAALVAAPRSRRAQVVAGLVLAPVVIDWARGARTLDPVRYTALRLVADAAYGSGVIVGAARARRAGPLLPEVVDADRVSGAFAGLIRRSRSALPSPR
jgi:mycofactocin glycosyltransferase